MNKPFSNTTVIELASVLAGPSVGMFFAELGAKVIKVENKKQGGDITRQWKIKEEKKESSISAYYSSVNWGKESLFLNLDDNQDKEKLDALILDADVVIVNFKPGDALKWDLDYESLKQRNNKLIYAEISGFPKSKRIAYDIVLQAESGFLAMNGEPKRNPVKLPVAFIDLFAAHQLKEGILLAMLAQQKDLKPKKISVNLYESALASLANQASNYLMTGNIPQALGSLHPNIAPYGEIFTCKDGQKIVLAIGSDKQFQQFCKIINAENIIGDFKFSSNLLRVKNRKLLAQLIKEKIKHYEGVQLSSLLQEHDVPAGLINDLETVFKDIKAKSRVLKEQKEGIEIQTVNSVAFTIKD